MPLDMDGFGQLQTDIAKMASRIDADGMGAGIAGQILEAAAVPIHEQMKANAARDPRRRSGDLYAALNTGKVKRGKKRGARMLVSSTSPEGLTTAALSGLLRLSTEIWSPDLVKA